VDTDAVLWRGRRVARGRDAVVAALAGVVNSHNKGDDPGGGALTDVEWLVGTGRWEALCSARAGTGDGHVTLLLKVVAGNWQIVYGHADS
jgi:hypothetical protein